MNAITSPENGNKARSSEADVWAAILQDLTDCVNEPNLPGKYNSGDSNYGRVTKGAAMHYADKYICGRRIGRRRLMILILWLTVASGYILRPVLPVISSC